MENPNGEFKGYTKASIESIERRFDEFQAQINRRFNDLGLELIELRTNHIAHLSKSIQDIDERQSRIQWTLIVALIGLGVNLALEIVKR